ncbi:MAG: fatty acid desaturase [Planctomycetota bacterium]|jgi:stearoyl-CoA desaturase (delta-9 desaturase)|nr:fatty acid desaturase [Planctomycetota bacterium]
MSTIPDIPTNPDALGADPFPIASGFEAPDDESSTVAPESTRNRSVGFAWGTIGWITLLHVGAVAALFCFTWVGAITAFLLFWLTGSVGICMGYHRLFAHRSFKTSGVVRWALAIIGTLGGEGSPLSWVAAHRKHHQFSDEDEDPHSPKDGLWWSHILWLFPRSDPNPRQSFQRYAKDLLQEPFHRFLHATFIYWHFVLGFSLFAAGWSIWGLHTGISLLMLGVFFRLTCVLHVTWLVNSAAHVWGYRNYETRDNSRNLWWVGLLAFGEGWHNNHHAFPSRARHGHRWWEFDLTYRTICVMEKLRIVWDVKHGHARA